MTLDSRCGTIYHRPVVAKSFRGRPKKFGVIYSAILLSVRCWCSGYASIFIVKVPGEFFLDWKAWIKDETSQDPRGLRTPRGGVRRQGRRHRGKRFVNCLFFFLFQLRNHIKFWNRNLLPYQNTACKHILAKKLKNTDARHLRVSISWYT